MSFGPEVVGFDLVDCYNHTLSSSLDRHAPVNRKTVVKRPTVRWFNKEVELAKRARRRAERKWRRTKLTTSPSFKRIAANV
ncbi:RNA-directed DNA polymerase from transposon X-element, partial [Paramuricea clavata]